MYSYTPGHKDLQYHYKKFKLKLYKELNFNLNFLRKSNRKNRNQIESFKRIRIEKLEKTRLRNKIVFLFESNFKF